MGQREDQYFSYMLRLWQAVSEAGSPWRASLEDPRTGERQGFADLQGLFGYLAARTDKGGAETPDRSDSPGTPENE
jgi:hypothetical protein